MALISAGAALLGALIGAVATLVATWLNKKLQYSGKIRLFAKIVNSKNTQEPWGFYGNKAALSFYVPIWLDVCNTCGISRIIRDLNLVAYLGDKEISSFVQIQAFKKEERIPLGDNESYTLVIPPNSALRFDMFFVLKETELFPENRIFDEIILRYFDENNCMHSYHLIKPEKIWEEGPLKKVKEWITLDKKLKSARR